MSVKILIINLLDVIRFCNDCIYGNCRDKLEKYMKVNRKKRTPIHNNHIVKKIGLKNWVQNGALKRNNGMRMLLKKSFFHDGSNNLKRFDFMEL
jgi:hypothetical protein